MLKPIKTAVSLLMLICLAGCAVQPQPTAIPSDEAEATLAPSAEISAEPSPEPTKKVPQNDLEKAMFDIENTVPEYTEVSEFNPTASKNIKAIVYDGMNIGDKKTSVFAYIGWPEGAKQGDDLPAVVLIHGGGGYAFHSWVKYWNDAGYVAIAMCNTGYFPTAVNAEFDAKDWTRTRKGVFKKDGYTAVPDCDHFGSSDGKLERMWMYHAAGQAILARNLLAADPCVDSTKIGVTGISWGGTITAQAIGFTKWAWAAPQYCSGYLNQSLTYSSLYCRQTKKYNELWRAETRFDNVDFPVLWMQWTQDLSAAITSTTLCYEDTIDCSQMSLRLNWFHGHDWKTPIEIVRFANSVVKGGQKLTKVLTQPDGSRNVDISIEIPDDAAKITAQAVYITQQLSYDSSKTEGPQQAFYTSALTVDGNRIYGTLPEDAHSFYVEVSSLCGGKTYYTASRFMDVTQ